MIQKKSVFIHGCQRAWIGILFCFAALLTPAVIGQQLPEYGPTNGALVIVGGAGLTNTISQRFIKLAGGLDAHLVVIPTAKGSKYYDENTVLEPWIKLGMKNVKMLHTTNRDVANSEDFVQVLRQANAVWFNGGRQWHLVDAYADTLTLKEIRKVLDRGGVIGGSSAGATIQGDYLVRGDVAGAKIMMTDDPRHQHGFAFLRHSAIDQHIDARNRWDDLIPVIKKYPELLGIGLSQDTAIIVQGDVFEVVGEAKVAVHDNTKTYAPNAKPYVVLSEGDRYNMKSRQVLSHAP